MFVDKVKIFVESGKGGNGCVSFRREKFVPFGGPDGGNGGKGGDVYLVAEPQMNTLYDFYLRPHYKAEDGQHGKGKNMSGKDGESLYIKVPCGTVVYKLDENNNLIFLGDLNEPYQTLLVAKGGRGGRGNTEFKSSTNQAPRVAELGQPSEKITLVLELKLIADVGIVGLPNAGKSTLLSVLTSAKPKIADYPFTTILPNLGVCDYFGFRFVLADIPGLVENAHKGKGLGTDFLRHIERTKFLLHLLDISVNDIEQIYKNYNVVINELKSYSKDLVKKQMIVVLNKVDVLLQEETEKIVDNIKKKIKNKYPVVAISAIKKQSLDILLKKIVNLLNKEKEYSVELKIKNAVQKQNVFQYQPEYVILRKEDRFVIKGKKIEDLVSMTDFSSEESVQRLQKILKKIGIEKLLRKEGIKNGDRIEIAGIEFNYFED
jgi:GTP-binding protein